MMRDRLFPMLAEWILLELAECDPRRSRELDSHQRIGERLVYSLFDDGVKNFGRED